MVYDTQWKCDVNKMFLKLSCQLKNGARKLLTVEKEEASTFQAVDLATAVADMLAELYR